MEKFRSLPPIRYGGFLKMVHECKYCGCMTNQNDIECYKLTPNKKAIELVEMMDKIILNNQLSVMCAIKCVEEILNVIEDERESFNWKSFYIEVNEELVKIYKKT